MKTFLIVGLFFYFILDTHCASVGTPIAGQAQVIDDKKPEASERNLQYYFCFLRIESLDY